MVSILEPGSVLGPTFTFTSLFDLFQWGQDFVSLKFGSCRDDDNENGEDGDDNHEVNINDDDDDDDDDDGGKRERERE